MYGSVPYITSHSQKVDTSIYWRNAAETFVEIWPLNDTQLVDFSSTGGVLEVFMFGSGDSPKIVQKMFAKVTGFIELPGWSAIGFHYSKWDEVNT